MTLNSKAKIILGLCGALGAVALIIGLSVGLTKDNPGSSTSGVTTQKEPATALSDPVFTQPEGVLSTTDAPTPFPTAATAAPTPAVAVSTVSPTGSQTAAPTDSIYCADMTLKCGSSKSCCTGLYESCEYIAPAYAGDCRACHHKSGFCGVERKCCSDSEHCVITEPTTGTTRRLRGAEDHRHRRLWTGTCVADTPVNCADSPIGVYHQCGGLGYTGSTCCDVGLECKTQNIWWSGCFQPDSTSVPHITFAPVTGGCTTPIAPYQQCGGADYHGSTCCTTGYTCTSVNYWWSGCLENADTTAAPTDPPTPWPTSELEPLPEFLLPIYEYPCEHGDYPAEYGCTCNTANGEYMLLPAVVDGPPARCVLTVTPDCENSMSPTNDVCNCDETDGLYTYVAVLTPGQEDKCYLADPPACTNGQQESLDNCVCEVMLEGFQLVATLGGSPDEPRCLQMPLPACANNDIPELNFCTCDVGGAFTLEQPLGVGSPEYCYETPTPPCKERQFPEADHCSCDAPNFQVINEQCYSAGVQLKSCLPGERESVDHCTCRDDGCVPIYEYACEHGDYPADYGCTCNTADGQYMLLPAVVDGPSARCVLTVLPDCENNMSPTNDVCYCDETDGLYTYVAVLTPGQEDKCYLADPPACSNGQQETRDNCVCDVLGSFQLVATLNGNPDEPVCLEEPLPACANNESPEFDFCTCDVGDMFRLEQPYGPGSPEYCYETPKPPCEERQSPHSEHCACDAPVFQVINEQCYPAGVQLKSCLHAERESFYHCTCRGDDYEILSGVCALKDTASWPTCVHLELPAEVFCQCVVENGAFELLGNDNNDLRCLAIPRPACEDGDYIDDKFCTCDTTAMKEVNGFCRPLDYVVADCQEGEDPMSGCVCNDTLGFKVYADGLCFDKDCTAGETRGDACGCDTTNNMIWHYSETGDEVCVVKGTQTCGDGEMPSDTSCLCTAGDLKVYSDGTCHDASKECAAGVGAYSNDCWCNTIDGNFVIVPPASGEPTCEAAATN